MITAELESGGGGGNRTPVRKCLQEAVYSHSRSFDIRPTELRTTGLRIGYPDSVSPVVLGHSRWLSLILVDQWPAEGRSASCRAT